jgi:general secretion pathway protein E
MDSLDMPFLVKETMKRVASQNEGVFLMSGPTGSGKTTTLYAILQFLNTATRHIITIENPVEYVIDNFTQIEVNGNLTFAHAMRAALRLDPDVIMVGEIRDEESANIALQAGSTGHMMLSTVHANSAAACLPRLSSLGLRNTEIAAVLSAMVAQRLVKSIPDPDDIEWVKPNDIEREWLVKQGLFSETFFFPRVAREKMGGRVAMVEMIEMTPKIRTLLESGDQLNNLISSIIEEAVLQPQFETLAQSGVRLALEGKTTLAEVMQAAADIGYIPKRKRFEQILLQQGAIQIQILDELQKELSICRAEGKIVNLDEEIVDRGICSVEVVAQAVRLAGFSAHAV